MRSLLIVATVGLLAAPRAEAYPQLQLATGASRCTTCHYAPAGGGLVNGFGRAELADTLSLSGDGGFLHGLWTPPPWLALGGDFRFATLVNNVGADEGAELAAFPMQLDLYARAEVGPISLYVSAGIRGSSRPDQSVGDRLTSASTYVSREHYLMWRRGPTGPYARAGRFFAPYGLRLAEHPVWVRRFLGFNTLEETYNVSGGFVSDRHELHLTVFTPDFFRPVGHRGSGGAAYYERRFGRRLAAAAQARLAISGDQSTRAQGGVVGKLLLPATKILLLGQLDLVHESFDADGLPSRWQLAGYLGASWLFRRGFLGQLMLERWDQDLDVSGVARSAVGAQLQFFPVAHVELSLYGRLAFIGTGSDDGSPSQLLMLQLHYSL
jgi:hypothetical protein